MDIEKAKKILEEDNTDYKVNDSIYEGLVILHKYASEHTHNWSYSFVHDQVYLGPTDMNFEEMLEKMSEKDVRRMGELGWFESEDSWSHF